MEESDQLRAALSGTILEPGATPPPSASLVAAASYHGVIAPLQRSYSKFPHDPATDELRAAALRARGIALSITRTAVEASGWLASAGIRHAVVKGPALAVAYADEDRTFSDLDILVSPDHMQDAIRVLTSNGGSVVDGRTWPRSDGVAELTIGLPTGVAVDLHTDLIQRDDVRRAFRFPPGPLLERVREIEVLGARIPVLEPEDALLHTALHAMVAGGHRLIWLADLDALARDRGIRWDVVTERARQARLALVLGVMLERTSLALSTPVPPHVLDSLLRRGRLWARGLVWFDRLRPTVANHGRVLRGQVLMRSTRDSTATSCVTLLKLLGSDVALMLIRDHRHPWRQALRHRAATSRT